MPPEMWFTKRMISFVKNFLNSSNSTVACVVGHVGMSPFGSHSACSVHTWNRLCIWTILHVEHIKRVAE